MKTIFALLVVCLSVVSCVQGSVDEPNVCFTKAFQFSLPVAPANLPGSNIQLPPVSSPPIEQNFSNTISKVSDVLSSVSLTITTLSIDNSDGALDFVSNIEVSISGTTKDTPETALASYVKSESSPPTIDMVVRMDSTTLLEYLSSGEVSITLTLVGGSLSSSEYQSLHGAINTSISMCLDVQASGSKSL